MLTRNRMVSFLILKYEIKLLRNKIETKVI